MFRHGQHAREGSDEEAAKAGQSKKWRQRSLFGSFEAARQDSPASARVV